MSDLHLAWLVIAVFCVGIVWSLREESVMSNSTIVWVAAVILRGLATSILLGSMLFVAFWAVGVVIV